MLFEHKTSCCLVMGKEDAQPIAPPKKEDLSLEKAERLAGYEWCHLFVCISKIKNTQRVGECLVDLET